MRDFNVICFPFYLGIVVYFLNTINSRHLKQLDFKPRMLFVGGLMCELLIRWAVIKIIIQTACLSSHRCSKLFLAARNVH